MRRMLGRVAWWLVAALAAALASSPARAATPGFDGAERVASGAESYAEIAWPTEGAREGWPLVGGALSLAFYLLPPHTTPAGAWRDYASALAAAGYRIVGRCDPHNCGGERFDRALHEMIASRRITANAGWPSRTAELAFRAEPHMLLAERGPPEAREHVVVCVYQARPADYAVRSARGRTMAVSLTLLGAPPERGRAFVHSAEEIAAALRSRGRVALHTFAFDAGTASLRPESQPQVAQLVRYLAGAPQASVYVVAHSDIGNPLEESLALTRRQAESVVAALRAAGVPAGRAQAYGVGPLAPLASNGDEAGRAENRRVEVVLGGPTGARP